MEQAARAATLMVATMILFTAAGPARAVDLLSHRAVYRLSLLAADRSADLAEARGGLVIELKQGCDGWISNQRLAFAVATSEGQAVAYDVRFSSWEAADRTQLRFNVRSFDNGELADEYRGRATLDGIGKAGRAEFVLPEDADDLPLPEGTVFPTEHVRQLVEAAQRGEHLALHDVFDGSGEEGLSRITAVIGPALQRTASAGGAERRWRVSLAYHSYTSTDAAPDFEAGFELSEGGVLHDLVLDYGDFSLKGDMEKLEALATQRCD